jgi:hypothetical protein
LFFVEEVVDVEKVRPPEARRVEDLQMCKLRGVVRRGDW